MRNKFVRMKYELLPTRLCKQAQPLAATKPWAVNLGNHETYDKANGIEAISARYRYSGMPFPAGSPDECVDNACMCPSSAPHPVCPCSIWYFSYEVGPVHLISVSSFYPGGFGPTSPLTLWLQKDLAAVSRSRTPWLLVSLHAPWYNSKQVDPGCVMRRSSHALRVLALQHGAPGRRRSDARVLGAALHRCRS